MNSMYCYITKFLLEKLNIGIERVKPKEETKGYEANPEENEGILVTLSFFSLFFLIYFSNNPYNFEVSSLPEFSSDYNIIK